MSQVYAVQTSRSAGQPRDFILYQNRREVEGYACPQPDRLQGTRSYGYCSIHVSATTLSTSDYYSPSKAATSKTGFCIELMSEACVYIGWNVLAPYSYPLLPTRGETDPLHASPPPRGTGTTTSTTQRNLTIVYYVGHGRSQRTSI